MAYCLQSEKQGDKRGNAQSDDNKPEQLDVESPLFWIKCHAPFLAAVGRRR